MCGIAGFIDRKLSPDGASELLADMTAKLHHRGPDHQGFWQDAERGVHLGHARLSIVDLKPTGHQPMVCMRDRFVLTYNGEIYNYQELKKRLTALGESFLGSSDTEVVLKAISVWGLEKALASFNGMFALAVWDRQSQVMYLARDRVGEKPLYYAMTEYGLVFASELKALRQHPHCPAEVDRQSLADYCALSYMPRGRTLFEGIRQLDPGHWTAYGAGNHRIHQEKAYWSLRDWVQDGRYPLMQEGVDQVIHETEMRLKKAVQLRMHADVPLGAFLSGGIDSSLVVALMQSQSSKPIKTFSMGFSEAGYDESGYARAVAEHLGTDHYEWQVTPKMCQDIIPTLPEIYDEPFADPSQIPTILVSKLAKQHVTVCLSGDGGDEVFGGYRRYFMGSKLWMRTGWCPSLGRRLLGAAMRLMSPHAWDQVLTLRGASRQATSILERISGDRIHKLSHLIGASNFEDLYRHMIATGGLNPWVLPQEDAKRKGVRGELALDRAVERFDLNERMMFWDSMGYLPGDILTKVDRASMSVSLESRIPLLDHELIEFAWRLPLQLKVRGGVGKWILRQVLQHYVPKRLFERPKMGFGVPIDQWLRGPLRDWAEDLLSQTSLDDHGFFQSQAVRLAWHEHLSGKRNWQYRLWNILMFQAWWRHWSRPLASSKRPAPYALQSGRQQGQEGVAILAGGLNLA